MRLLIFNMAMDLDDPLLEFAVSWVNALARRVAFVHVITMRTGRVIVPGNVRIYSVGKEKGYSEPRRAVEFYKHLLRIVRQERIDICFSHMIPIFTVLAAPLLRRKGIPIVTWYAHPSVTPLLKLAHHFSARIVTSLPTSYPYKVDKVQAIGQGVDTDLFSPSGNISPEDPPTILCVGRLSAVKDHSTLLEAVSLVQKSFARPFRVVIIGGPLTPQDQAYARLLQQKLTELNIQDKVRFEPAVPMVHLPNWYRRCAVHVNLTPTGFGDKVAWEAMACETPCVVANQGFVETLGPWASRLLFRHKDAEDLAERLRWALSLNQAERKELGAYLRQQVVRLHNLERLAEQLVGVFQEARNC
ncbi:MAG: glycosyltransferase family 4 protein [Deltaproteobacteria bacterium]|nr:glycosyltransferase family 4 protein [Deltaproteobacteria bacterium]